MPGFDVEMATELTEEELQIVRELIGVSPCRLLHGIAFLLMERFNDEGDVKARATWLNQAAAIHAVARQLEP